MNIFGVTTAEAAFVGGAVGSILIFSITLSIFLYVLLIIACWKIFKKAGEPGWKAIIPIYNFYIMYKIVGMQGWWWLMVGFSILYSIVATGTGYSPNLTPEELVVFDFSAHPSLLPLLLYSALPLFMLASFMHFVPPKFSVMALVIPLAYFFYPISFGSFSALVNRNIIREP